MKIKEGKELKKEYAVIVNNATVRFNMASEKIDNLKEYFVKLMKHESHSVPTRRSSDLSA